MYASFGPYRRWLALRALASLAAMLAGPGSVGAPTALPTQEGDFVATEFRFRTGEVLPELRLHYTTLRIAVRTVASTTRYWYCTAPAATATNSCARSFPASSLDRGSCSTSGSTS